MKGVICLSDDPAVAPIPVLPDGTLPAPVAALVQVARPEVVHSADGTPPYLVVRIREGWTVSRRFSPPAGVQPNVPYVMATIRDERGIVRVETLECQDEALRRTGSSRVIDVGLAAAQAEALCHGADLKQIRYDQLTSDEIDALVSALEVIVARDDTSRQKAVKGLQLLVRHDWFEDVEWPLKWVDDMLRSCIYPENGALCGGPAGSTVEIGKGLHHWRCSDHSGLRPDGTSGPVRLTIRVKKQPTE